MIDLHIHTVYSDGTPDFDEIINLSNRMERISVTDHNSVAFYLELKQKTEDFPEISTIANKFVVGTEITMEGYPDYLLYFSEVQNMDKNTLMTIEKRLKVIRENEAIAIKAAYESLGFTSWDADFSQVNKINKIPLEARTKELAAICYLKRTGSVEYGHFEMEDLRKARIARRSIAVTEIPQVDTPIDIAKLTGGTLVLAHPIRTAIKNTGRSSELRDIEVELERLFSVFFQGGGTVIEWEFLDGEIEPSANRYPALDGAYPQIRRQVKDAMLRYNFKCVWGSDTHKKHPNYYENWEDAVRMELKDFQL